MYRDWGKSKLFRGIGSSHQLGEPKSMEEAQGNSDDLTGKKKSKFKILKTRLLGRMKRKETEGEMKQSQSAGDITVPAGVRGDQDSEDEFGYSQGMLGTRALSHDSIFFANQSETSPEPERVLSQDNVHCKIKVLQMKLKGENIRVGPPPLIIPSKRTDDIGASSEDDGLPHSPPEISLHEDSTHGPEDSTHGPADNFHDTDRHHSCLGSAGTGSEEKEQGFSQPPPSPSSTSSPGVDFNTPAQFVPCLDNSAARHRMSIKPRNQRASTKGTRLHSSDYRPRSESLNDIDHPLPEKEAPREIIRCRSNSTQVRRSGEDLTTSEVSKSSPVRGPKSPGENYRRSQTEMQRRNTDVPRQIFSPGLQFEPKGRITSNPIFLRPVPLESDLGQTQEPSSRTVTLTPVSTSAELKTPLVNMQKPAPIKHHIASQPQGSKELINSGKRSPSNYSPMSRSPVHILDSAGFWMPMPPNSVNNSARDFNQVVQGNNKPLEARCTAEDLDAVIPMTSYLKRNPASSKKAALLPEPNQRTTAVPVVRDAQQRPGSGSFRFSVSSAWDRPRTDSFKGEGEQAVQKTEDSLVNKTVSNHAVQEWLTPKPEEVRSDDQASNTSFEAKMVEDLVRLQEQSGGRREETKPKDLPRNPESGQEKQTTQRSASPRCFPSGGGGDGSLRCVQVQGETGAVVGGGEQPENEKRSTQTESEEDTEGRTSFGVKLRSTSLSLRYHSDMTQAELKSKRRSAEVCGAASRPNPQASFLPRTLTNPGGPEEQCSIAVKTAQPPRDDKDDIASTEHQNVRPHLLRKPSSQNSIILTPFSEQTSTSSSPPEAETPCRERAESFKKGDKGSPIQPASSFTREAEPPASEPAWMTVAWEKTRSIQQLFTSRLPKEFMAPQTSTQTLPLWKDDRKPTSLGDTDVTTQQEKANRKPPVEKKVEKTPLTERKSAPVPKRADRPALVDGKAEPKKATPTSVTPYRATPTIICETKTEGRGAFSSHMPEASPIPAPGSRIEREDRWQKRTEPFSASASASSQQPVPGRGQPSWMELAKRKSLAWTDKAMN